MPPTQNTPSPDLPEFAGRTQGQVVMDMARFGFKMFGADGTVAGVISGEGRHEWLVQTGAKNVTTDGAGVGVMFFKKPFPTACLAVVPFGQYPGFMKLGTVWVDKFSFISSPSTTAVVTYIAIGC